MSRNAECKVARPVIKPRLLLSCLAASACAFAPAQGLGQNVSVSLPPQPLVRLIPALAKQTGVDLQVARSVENDVAMIKVKEVPLNLVMRKIAGVTNRVWKQEGDRYTLTSSIEADRAAEKRVLARRAAMIGKAVAKLAQDPAYRKPWSQDEATWLANKTESFLNPIENRLDGKRIDFEDIRGRSPVDRALAALLISMDPAELAGVWNGKRVYATRPTAMQRPLPIQAQTIFERLLREHSMFVDASNEFKARQGPSTATFSMTGISRGEFMGGNPKLGLGKAIVRIEGSELGRDLAVNLTLTDTAGAPLLKGIMLLSVDFVEPTTYPAKGPESVVPTDPFIKEINGADKSQAPRGSRMSLSVMDGEQTIPLEVPYPISRRNSDISPPLKQLLLAPNVVDPLSFSAGKILDAAAEARGENVVACFDDGVFSNTIQELAGGITPTQYLSSWGLQQYQEVEISDGWLTIRPNDPAGAQRRQVNRNALAKLTRSIDRNKLLLLDDLCAFSLTQETAMKEDGLDWDYIRLLNLGAANAYDPNKWNVYQLFGSLTDPQKQALGNGAGVMVQNLTPSGRKALGQYIFDTQVEPHLSGGEPMTSEWTQLLPNGLPSGAMVTAKVQRDEAAYCMDSKIGAAQILSAHSLATAQFLKETPGLQDGALRFDRFSAATQWTYSFEIALAPGISVSADVTDGAINGANTNPDFKTLPAPFQSAYGQHLGTYRKYFGRMDFTKGHQGLPP